MKTLNTISYYLLINSYIKNDLLLSHIYKKHKGIKLKNNGFFLFYYQTKCTSLTKLVIKYYKIT